MKTRYETERDQLIYAAGEASKKIFSDLSENLNKLFKKYFEKNKYLVNVNIPKYDILNPKHYVIKNNIDLAVLNNPAYDNFFVLPGTYNQFSVTQSGTLSNPKTIALYVDNDLHPGQLDQVISLPLNFTNCHNWIIDRLGTVNHSDSVNRVSYKLYPNCSNIVFNRMYFSNFCRAFEITSDQKTSNNTDNIVIQNSRFENMARVAINNDDSAIMLRGSDIYKYTKVSNVKILNSEFVNCNDSIHALRLAGSQWNDVDYQGLIIDGNQFSVNSDMYTNGRGVLDKAGNFALTENAIDLKAGSNSSVNPIVITNNYAWGYKKTDTNGGGSGDMGYGMVFHYEVNNIVIDNNTVFDCDYGIGFRDNSGCQYSGRNISLKGNRIVDIKNEAITLINNATNCQVEGNLLVSNNIPATMFNLYQASTDKSIIIKGNHFVNMKEPLVSDIDSHSLMIENFFYGFKSKNPGHGLFLALSDAKLQDEILSIDNYTNNPKNKIIKNAKLWDE